MFRFIQSMPKKNQSKAVYLIFIFVLVLASASCTKPVYTVYYEKENYTEFTTHPLEIKAPTGHKLIIETSRRCPGQTLCTGIEIKINISTKNRFEFLKGKDCQFVADEHIIDLNKRDYKFSFDATAVNTDGTSGTAEERWLAWIDLEDFVHLAESEKVTLFIENYQIQIPKEKRENWKILIDHEALVATMDDEQKRVYGDYTETPVREARRREQLEQKKISEAEEETWKLVKDSENPDDLKFFLEQYPDSPYSVPAKLKLNQLLRTN